ncbi:Ribosomal small subunit pseudouridine synthase A [Hyphomonas oceanitis SCH89]|uniref:Ribosomal small subunit pseudouridine synthase A n=1 Tax=Hyphomonas oceanitis SCH89 TaxID=1280953 RepID=A0A059G8H8_9PROT|nr:Ribosomal small subunit pseudouridine synthase A [Hyphomonas oceanitis SCH89]
MRARFAAVANHVEALHRTQLGPLTLDGLAEGVWRVFGADEVRSFQTL